MFRILIYLTAFLGLLSQNKLNVFVDTQNNKIARFEREIIENVVKLMDSRKKTNTLIDFEELNSFNESFTVFNKSNSSESLVINKISYTEERAKKYAFSLPYMYNFYTVLTLKGNNSFHKDTQFNKQRLYGAVIGTIFETKIKELSKQGIKYRLFHSTVDMAKALRLKEIDFMLGDYVDSWEYELKSVFLYDTNQIDKFCILFPKESQIISDFNSVLGYYIKSHAYLKLIKDYFGNDAVTFFKKVI